MGARSGAVLDRTPRVKRLRIREDFDDSACHRPAQPFARRHDRRPSDGRPAPRPACIYSARRSAACRGARTGTDGRSGACTDGRAGCPALPPGSPLIGRPEGNVDAAKLAPVAPPPIPAAADKLPTAQLKLPPGFHIEVYASGIANTRSLRIGDKGTVFVGTRFGNKVTAIVKKDGKTETKAVAEGLYRPNGLAFHKGTLYIAELSQISKIDNSRPSSTSRRSRR